MTFFVERQREEFEWLIKIPGAIFFVLVCSSNQRYLLGSQGIISAVSMLSDGRKKRGALV